MDLSKLPKLSQSPAPPPQEPDAATPSPQAMSPLDYHPTRAPAVGPEVWASVIIGLIFILIGWNFAKYAGCVITGRTYHTTVTWGPGPNEGAEVPYPQLYGHVIWNDSAMFLFGLALLAEAAVLVAVSMNARFQRPLIALGFILAFLATAYNLVVASVLFNAGILPLMSLLAVAFGGCMAMYLWRMLQSFQPVGPASR